LYPNRQPSRLPVFSVECPLARRVGAPLAGGNAMRQFVLTLLILALAAPLALAQTFDPVLHQKAADHQAWLETWHTGDIGLAERGLGGLSAQLTFTDDTYSEIACLHALGDSMIWTGMYLGSQALRFAVTQDAGARAEVIRGVQYMHNNMMMTQTPGYIGRYADRDEPPYNCNIPPDHGWKVLGEGEWEGYYWVHETSRDQYSGYMWGMGLAYEHIDDEATRAIIKEDLRAVIQMLEDNEWHITDENGEWTGNGAHWIGPVIRLTWLVIAASVIDEPHYWELLDEQYAINKPVLWVDTWSFINRYSEFYGNNLRHLAFQSLFRLWPDRPRLQEMYDIWVSANRPSVTEIHNPWFDAVHWTGCTRLGVCTPEDETYIFEDAEHTLGLYWDTINYKQEITCSDQPLDPFSVLMDQLLDEVPWLREIIDIKPQTKDARELNDRHWTDMYWQSGGHFDATCHTAEDRTWVGSGFDYQVAYWMGVYYGILPGDGPYGDDDLTDDDDDDDDTTPVDDDDDTTPVDDDDDDTTPVDDDDDATPGDDDDDATPPAGDDDDAAAADDDDDDNDSGGCG
jgi:hypothetical protein